MQTIPAGNIYAMSITLMTCTALPMLLAVFYRCRNKAKLSSFFVGCGTFFIFSLVLEQMLHVIVFEHMGAVSKAINNNIWLYALYGGLAAGIFEELGRFAAMNLFLKSEQKTKADALMYGAGHSGLEALAVVGMSTFLNLLTANSINNGTFQSLIEDGSVTEAQIRTLAPLWETSTLDFCLSGVERVLAIILQIALSVLMYYGIKKMQIKYLGILIGIHAGVDFISVVAAQYCPVLLVTELIIAAMTAAVAYYAYKKYQELE